MAITDVNSGEAITDTKYQTIVDTVENTTSGHDHDGSNSRLIKAPILVDSGRGSATANGDTVLDTISIGAGDLTVNDFILIYFKITCETASNDFGIYAKDAGNDAAFVDGSYTGGGESTVLGIATIYQRQQANTKATTLLVARESLGAADRSEVQELTTLDANWITTAFDIELHANAGGANTAYYDWHVFKVKA